MHDASCNFPNFGLIKGLKMLMFCINNNILNNKFTYLTCFHRKTCIGMGTAWSVKSSPEEHLSESGILKIYCISSTIIKNIVIYTSIVSNSFTNELSLYITAFTGFIRKHGIWYSPIDLIVTIGVQSLNKHAQNACFDEIMPCTPMTTALRWIDFPHLLSSGPERIGTLLMDVVLATYERVM